VVSGMLGCEVRVGLPPGAVATVERFLAARLMRPVYHAIAFLKSFVS
jgi:hypothetical protein